MKYEKRKIKKRFFNIIFSFMLHLFVLTFKRGEFIFHISQFFLISKIYFNSLFIFISKYDTVSASQ